MTDAAIRPDSSAAIKGVPKVELHVHLEGSLTPEVSLRLANRNGLDIGASTVDELRDLYKFRDFRHFLTLYGELTFLLAEPKDFTDAVLAYASQLAAQGGIYVEMTLTLGTHVHFKEMDPTAVMEAAWEGAERASTEFGVTVRFLLDHVRSFSAERCHETVRWCRDYRDLGVVGFGLAGPEKGWPASKYREAIEQAAAWDVPFVPHAGEECGSDDIWDALSFAPCRIGHGLSAVTDASLMEQLRERHIMIEACPTSNVVLGHATSYAAHPFRKLFNAGVPVSLNTDDPPMFGTSLLREYTIAHEQLGLSISDLNQVTEMAIEHSLVDADTKRTLMERCHTVALSAEPPRPAKSERR